MVFDLYPSDLLHLTQLPQVSSMLLQMARFHSLMQLSGILLCVSVHLIYLSIDRHLVCFHILADLLFIYHKCLLHIVIHLIFRIYLQGRYFVLI